MNSKMLQIGVFVFVMLGLSIYGFAANNYSNTAPMPLPKGKVVSIEVKADEAAGVDIATIKTKDGAVYMYKMKKGKVEAWKKASDTEWKVAQ